MSEFSGIVLKLKHILNELGTAKVTGLDLNQFSFFFQDYLISGLISDGYSTKINLIITSTEEEAEKLTELLRLKDKRAHFYPGLSSSPFSSVIQSESALNKRHSLLFDLKSQKKITVVTSYSSLFLKVPAPEFFDQNLFNLECSDIIEPSDLAKQLVTMGYDPSPTIEEPGTFSQKGEIFDLYPINGQPVRIHYFDDMIEEIFTVDKETLKTIKNLSHDSIQILQTPKTILKEDFILNFRRNLSRPPLSFKYQQDFRTSSLSKLNSGLLFENYPLYFPLFFEKTGTLLDYLPHDTMLFFFGLDSAKNHFNTILEEMNKIFDDNQQNQGSDKILPFVNQVYHPSIDKFPFKSVEVEPIDINIDFSDVKNKISFNLEQTNVFYRKNSQSPKTDKYEFIKDLFHIIKNLFNKGGKLIICYKHETSKDEIEYLLKTNELFPKYHEQIFFKKSSLSTGVYYPEEKTFFLTEGDLFAHRIVKTKKKKRTSSDLFADQISTLKTGDYVIHKDFGIGKYLGMENIQLGNSKNDFLVIEYHDGDKVYVPVYKLNLIQKHAEHQAGIKIDNLKTKKFESIKSKAKSSVKRLAFDLLELQAKRQLRKGFQFSEPDHLFKEFELSFPFEETPDQLEAINDVLDDMQSEKPMDRLICGDVGFGKTEVAMRAAYKAVLDQKQVALLVPTTVLAYQHYNTFIKRFENFPVNIEFISRFKTTKQITEISKKVKEGLVDIVIGTHKLLSGQLQFNDLGLLVIDEEQRFGVAHKEKLKLLKENVDSLILTATPIPRTLQMSFLGIKELSLIQTAPPKRQSIKSYIIKEDPYTLKMAISKELGRGGQVFVVHNRVHDINDYAAKIKKLVPSAKVVVAHGQMKERELERHIKDFYEHKYDILVSTTIIESGIDIPSANTMIIDRADMYGLSQLHQLRGRIGRSDKKAYAYFIIPSTRNLSEIANKRLKALQTYADMGSGFSLATSDLEIRGSGDILGAEQSGHIANIGLELYMDLLKEAIQDLKGNPQHINKNIEIQTPYSSSIPPNYIGDHGLRLKYYKRLANCYDFENLNSIIDELVDQYGQLPIPLKNLHTILKSRLYFSNLALNSIKVQTKSVTLNFDPQQLDQDENLKNKIITTFMSRPKVYKIKPNYSVVCSFKEEVDPDSLEEFAKYIASQIDLC